MGERMNDLENKLNAEKGSRRELERLGGDLRKGNNENKKRIGKMEGLIEELVEQAEEDKLKIEELEKAVLGWEEQSEKNEEKEENNEEGEEGKNGEKEAFQRDKENENNMDKEMRNGKYIMNFEVKSIVEGKSYLAEIPEALSDREWEWEFKERKSRKKNLIIKAVRAEGKGRKEEIKELIRKYMMMDIYIEKMKVIGGGTLVELQSMENKIMIMKRKGMLKGIGIWIEDDHTVREKQVQVWLEKLEREERKLGHKVRVGYQKVMVDEQWYEWKEKEGKLEQVAMERGNEEMYV